MRLTCRVCRRAGFAARPYFFVIDQAFEGGSQLQRRSSDGFAQSLRSDRPVRSSNGFENGRGIGFTRIGRPGIDDSSRWFVGRLGSRCGLWCRAVCNGGAVHRKRNDGLDGAPGMSGELLERECRDELFNCSVASGHGHWSVDARMHPRAAKERTAAHPKRMSTGKIRVSSNRPPHPKPFATAAVRWAHPAVCRRSGASESGGQIPRLELVVRTTIPRRAGYCGFAWR